MSFDLREGIVRILQPNGETAGTGFIVTKDGLIATCSHVLQSEESQKRGDLPPEKRTIIFHVTGEQREALVEPHWWRLSTDEDVAILRVGGDLPLGVRPLLLGSSSGTNNHSFDTFGFPSSNPKQGIWGEGHISGETKIQDVQVLQLSSKEITAGFSGAPVVDRARKRIVGMVTSIMAPDKYGKQGEIAFITPTETLRDVCSALTFSDICPYRSLEAFTEDHTDFFKGRDRIIQALVDSLRNDSRFLAVFGPSGCGKSSVVQAGLIPRLRKGGDVPGSDRWDIKATRPTDHSFEQRVSELSQTTMHMALVIDQFEELFVTKYPEAERKKVVKELTNILNSSSHVTLIILMRNDFYSLFVDEEDLAQLKKGRLVDIPSTIELDELSAIVKEPAETVGWQFEDEGLIETIVNDALESTLDDDRKVGNNTILPLLEFALTQLWERRQDGTLTRAAYKSIGGVTGGLAQSANDAYYNIGHVGEGQRPLVKRIFTDLVHLGDKDRPKPIPDSLIRRELATLVRKEDEKADVYQVVENLVALRLLVKDRDPESGRETVEIVHYALLQKWALLKGWIEEDRLFLAWRQKLDDRNQEWIATNTDPIRRDPYRLLAGLDLAEATDWLEKRRADLNEILQLFIEASIEQKEQQEAEKRQQLERELTLQRQVVSRQRLLLTALSIFSVVVIVLASLAGYGFLQAQMEAQIARSDALAAEATLALAQNKLDLALLLSVEAFQTHDTYEARNSLLSALEQSPHIITILRGGSSSVDMLAFGPDDRTLFASDGYSTFVWNTPQRTDHLLRLQEKSERIGSAALSQDGRTLVTSYADGVWLWDTQTGKQRNRLAKATPGLPANVIPTTSVAFSPDGTLVASGRCKKYSPSGDCLETYISIWKVPSTQAVGTPVIIDVHADVSSIALSPNDRYLASSSQTGVQLWDVTTGQSSGSQLSGSNGANNVTFSPDGRKLAAGNNDNTIHFWDVATGQPTAV